MQRSIRNVILRLQHRLSMTRSEFVAICTAGGLLLMGYAADMVFHRYSRFPSGRYASEDSVFSSLAAGLGNVDLQSAEFSDTDSSRMGLAVSDSSNPSPSRPYTQQPQAVDQPLLDINSASREQLILLPGIGPALADRIVRSRDANGPFLNISDLKRVSGIGPAKVERIASLVIARQDQDQDRP